VTDEANFVTNEANFDESIRTSQVHADHVVEVDSRIDPGLDKRAIEANFERGEALDSCGVATADCGGELPTAGEDLSEVSDVIKSPEVSHEPLVSRLKTSEPGRKPGSSSRKGRGAGRAARKMRQEQRRKEKEMARRERRLADQLKSLPPDVAGQNKLLNDLISFSADVREELVELYHER
jgi:hypothetical protein